MEEQNGSKINIQWFPASHALLLSYAPETIEY